MRSLTSWSLTDSGSHIFEGRAVVLRKLGRSKLLELPGWYLASPALFEKPFIAQPPCRPAILRKSDKENVAAVGGNLGVAAFFGNLPDTVQDTGT